MPAFASYIPARSGCAGIGAAVFLCLGNAEARVADEYIFQICPLMAGIPWLLHFGLKRKASALTASELCSRFVVHGALW